MIFILLTESHLQILQSFILAPLYSKNLEPGLFLVFAIMQLFSNFFCPLTTIHLSLAFELYRRRRKGQATVCFL